MPVTNMKKHVGHEATRTVTDETITFECTTCGLGVVQRRCAARVPAGVTQARAAEAAGLPVPTRQCSTIAKGGSSFCPWHQPKPEAVEPTAEAAS